MNEVISRNSNSLSIGSLIHSSWGPWFLISWDEGHRYVSMSKGSWETGMPCSRLISCSWSTSLKQSPVSNTRTDQDGIHRCSNVLRTWATSTNHFIQQKSKPHYKAAMHAGCLRNFKYTLTEQMVRKDSSHTSIAVLIVCTLTEKQSQIPKTFISAIVPFSPSIPQLAVPVSACFACGLKEIGEPMLENAREAAKKTLNGWK